MSLQLDLVEKASEDMQILFAPVFKRSFSIVSQLRDHLQKDIVPGDAAFSSGIVNRLYVQYLRQLSEV